MALGVTHVHLRFEACTDEDRAAEVEDLVEGIRPPLNGVDAPSGQEDLEPAAADPAAADPAAADPAAADPAAADPAAA
ncbi:MAG TPA: hypothetical protein VLR47_06745, partial [Rhodospirillales bacterium]|nr:hypothetical protein [Rhodospirillales bacterium]